ncbi:uncharacterized protein PSFLO_03148 [Pseudozyma flocculosa]|uniref:Uncharacterized protein n=1 Tax=Pseudozyma flocculosa TaxID=84751 RepID=A0A5C3F027_9BASI|nr:uncharacterized protein PSFLO_03148 [Pseudozyma flocculosa]
MGRSLGHPPSGVPCRWLLAQSTAQGWPACSPEKTKVTYRRSASGRSGTVCTTGYWRTDRPRRRFDASLRCAAAAEYRHVASQPAIRGGAAWTALRCQQATRMHRCAGEGSPALRAAAVNGAMDPWTHDGPAEDSPKHARTPRSPRRSGLLRHQVSDEAEDWPRYCALLGGASSWRHSKA